MGKAIEAEDVRVRRAANRGDRRACEWRDEHGGTAMAGLSVWHVTRLFCLYSRGKAARQVMT
jgi:hypothetical protein